MTTNHRISTAIALTVALSVTAVPATARTFDFNSTGSMVQAPLPPGSACATRRAALDRRVPCRNIYAAADETTRLRTAIGALGTPTAAAVAAATLVNREIGSTNSTAGEKLSVREGFSTVSQSVQNRGVTGGVTAPVS